MSQNSNRTPLGGGEGAGIGRFAGSGGDGGGGGGSSLLNPGYLNQKINSQDGRMAPTKKPNMKEEELSPESQVGSQKRKSDSDSGGSGAPKLSKLMDLALPLALVPSALYRVARSFRDNSGQKFAVDQGELVKFIRPDSNPNCVEVMTQFEKTGIIPDGILEKEAVPRICPCQNIGFIEEKHFLNHQVLQHYYSPLYNYLETWRLNRSVTFSCPVEKLPALYIHTK